MEVASLKAQIKSNKIPNFMIFTGDQWEMQKIYVKQISKVKGLETRRIDSIKDIYSALKNRSFVKKSYLYLVRDDAELMTNEKLWAKLEDLIGDNILLLFVTKVDKRKKFHSKWKTRIIEFDVISPKILIKYIKKKIDLCDSNCEKLIELCEGNYGRALLEIDKIKCFMSGSWTQLKADDAFFLLREQGVIYEPPADAIFDLAEAIMKRQKKKSFALLQESHDSGEATMVMLTVLFNTAKSVLQIQSCHSKNIAESTGLTGFQIYKAKELSGYYKESELIDMLHFIRNVETGIKTGRIEDRFAMDYLLLSIL